MTRGFSLTPDNEHHDFSGVAYGLLGSCIWGACMAVSSEGIADGFSAEDLVFLRYLTSGLLLLPLLALSNLFRQVGWTRALLLTLLAGPVFAVLAAHGFLYAPLVHGTVVQAATLILSGLLLIWWRSKSEPRFSYLAALLVLLVGLAAVAGPLQPLQQEISAVWKGDLLFMLAGVMWALFMALLWYWRVDALAATVVVAVLSALLYCPLYLMLHSPLYLSMLDFDQVVEQVLFQGVLSGVFALYAFNKAVQYLGLRKAVLFPAFAPAITMLLGMLLFHRVPALSQWLGFIIVAAGLLLGFYHDTDQPTEKKHE